MYRSSKWLSLSLFAYVATLFAVHSPWARVGYHLMVPRKKKNETDLTIMERSTTISPYLFFWQASQERSWKERPQEPSRSEHAPKDAPAELGEVVWRHQNRDGVLQFHCPGDPSDHCTQRWMRMASRISRPLRMRPRPCVRSRGSPSPFSRWRKGTGMLALPVLGGSVAYALGEAMHWPVGWGSGRTQKHFTQRVARYQP